MRASGDGPAPRSARTSWRHQGAIARRRIPEGQRRSRDPDRRNRAKRQPQQGGDQRDQDAEDAVLPPDAGFEEGQLACRVNRVDRSVIALNGSIRSETEAGLLPHDATRMRRSFPSGQRRRSQRPDHGSAGTSWPREAGSRVRRPVPGPGRPSPLAAVMLTGLFSRAAHRDPLVRSSWCPSRLVTSGTSPAELPAGKRCQCLVCRRHPGRDRRSRSHRPGQADHAVH